MASNITKSLELGPPANTAMAATTKTVERVTDLAVSNIDKTSDIYKAISSWSRNRMVTNLNNRGMKSSEKKSILTERIMNCCNEESTNRIIMEWKIMLQSKKKSRKRKRDSMDNSIVDTHNAK